MPSRSATIDIRGRDAGARRVIKGVSAELKQLRALAGGLGIAFGAAQLGRSLVGGFRDAIRVAADFRFEMSAVRAATDATGAEFAQLTKLAKDLGAATQFSASEAAQAQAELGKAGFSAKEIMDSLRGTLLLAGAGERDLAQAAGIASSTLRGFGLEAKDTARVVDVLSLAANKSLQSVQEIGEAMSYASAAAKLTGLSLEETSAALSILADREIKASRGGTALRGALATFLGTLEEDAEGLGALNKQLFDAEGQFVGLANAIEVMQRAGIKGGDAFRIFGRSAGTAMGILLDLGPGALRQMTTALEQAEGAAKRIEAVRWDNLAGDIEQLSGAWESVQIALGDLVADSPSIRALVQGLAEALQELSEAFNSQDADVMAAFALMLVDVSRGAFWLARNLTTLTISIGSLFTLITDGIEYFRETGQFGGRPGFLDALLESTQEQIQELDKAGEMIEETLLETRKRIADILMGKAPRQRQAEPEAPPAAAPPATAEDLSNEIKVVAKAYLDFSEAVQIFVDQGRAGFTKMLEEGRKIEPLAAQISEGIRSLAVTFSQQLGSTLVEAAFGADVAWGEFFRNFLKQIAVAIAQALILRAVMRAFGVPFNVGGSVGAAGAAGGSFGAVGMLPPAQVGYIVPGTRSTDSVPILATPGEAVIPRETVARFLRASDANSAPGGGLVLQVTSEENARRTVRRLRAFARTYLGGDVRFAGRT